MEIRQAISMYLTAKAYTDNEFKNKFENPNKNLDECVAFITYRMYEKAKEQVEKEKDAPTNKSARVGCIIPSDDEIFALAEQYYLDEDLKVENWNFFDAKLVSVSATTFSDEEKAKMRQEAIKKYQDDVIAEQKKKEQERKDKAKKAKEKTPSNPILVPDTPAKKSEEPKSETKAEVKPKAVIKDLFGDF